MAGKAKMAVCIRGTVYPSARAAAEAFGIKPDSVYAALARGMTDGLGLGRGRRRKQGSRNGKAKPFTIAGQTFPSIRAASVALGFAPPYLSQAMNRGGETYHAKIQSAAMLYAARRDGQAGKGR